MLVVSKLFPFLYSITIIILPFSDIGQIFYNSVMDRLLKNIKLDKMDMIPC
jgi:hypothetical protein